MTQDKTQFKPVGSHWGWQIPTHWKIASLKWISKISAGGTPDKNNADYWRNGTIPWLNSGAVNQWVITEPSAFITEEAYQNSSAKWIPKGALVIALAGQGKTKGMVAQLAIPTTCNQSMASIVPDDRIHPRFLVWWLATNYTPIRNLAGGEQRDGLNLEMVGGIPCPLPPIEEQGIIADFLDRETARLDDLAKAKERLLELLGEKQRTFTAMVVSRGLNLRARMKDSGHAWLGNIPAHWEVKRTKRVFFERDDRSETGEEEMLTVSHITGVTKRSEKDVNMFEAETNEGYKICSPGNLVINTLWAWMGAMGISPEEGIVSPAYHVYELSDEILPGYVDALVRTPAFIKEVTRFSTGVWSSRLRLYPEGLFEARIPVPPMDEQKAIVAAIEKEHTRTSEFEAALRDSITLLKERRAALIAAAVTGQIPIPEMTK